jgi:hypothetical protein
LATLVEVEYIKLASSVSVPATMLAQCGDFSQHQAPTSCFTCLARVPSYTLTCGHRYCDPCILSHGESTKCPLCGIDNMVSFHPKPAAAGVRILHLGGEIGEARELAMLLKKLRSKLTGPVHHYFDIVFCSGIGILFAVLMICQGASIEDYVYHLKDVKRVKVRKKNFSFGGRLQFDFCDLQRSPIKLILCFKNRVVPSYR